MTQNKREAKLVLFFDNGLSKEIDCPEEARPVGMSWVFPDVAGISMWDTIPLFENASHNNLFGRMMTLLEAIIPEPERLKAVKTLMSREIGEFSDKLRMKVVYASKSDPDSYARSIPSSEEI